MKTDIKAISALWRLKRRAEIIEEKATARKAEDARKKIEAERKADERYIGTNICYECKHFSGSHRVVDGKCTMAGCNCRGFGV